VQRIKNAAQERHFVDVRRQAIKELCWQSAHWVQQQLVS
jgi:hypothetical protein